MQSFYKKEWKGRYSIYIPLLLLAAVNLMLYGERLSIRGILWMAGYAFVEEALYRGFLLSALTGKYEARILQGAASSSFLFALMHIVNIYAGATVLYVAVQGLCALAAGFCFAVVACRERSIVPCAVLHAFINITSLGAEEQIVAGNVQGGADLSSREAVIFTVAAALYLIYGICLYQRGTLQKKEEEEYEALH